MSKRKAQVNDIKLSFEGVPFKGAVPDLKDNDTVANTPVLVHTAKVIVLRITEGSSDVQVYEDILQEVVSGQAVISIEEKQYDPKIEGWRLLLTYTKLHYELPKIKEIRHA